MQSIQWYFAEEVFQWCENFDKCGGVVVKSGKFGYELDNRRK
jgi:hypothetical protein